VNEEELLRRMAALKAAGATDDEFEAFVSEQDAPKPIMASVGTPSVAPSGRDATTAPFRNLQESGAAYEAAQATKRNDLKGVLATMAQGATFNLADDVLPIGESVDYLKQRSPAVAGMANLAGGVAVPGLAALKAIKAIRPTTMAGQVALGSGLGAAETALATAGDTEGSLGDRIRAGLKAAPVGAGAGAVLGAVPGAITKTGNAIQAIKRKPKEAAAAARSAVRLLRGKQPDLGDAVTLGKLLGGGEARQPFTGLGQNVDIRELATRAKRMNPNVLDGMPSRDVANLVGQGTTDGPKRLAALAAKPGPDVDEVVRLGVEGSRPKLTLMNPSTSTGPRPPVAGPAVSRPMPTASLEGATAPVVEPPRSRPTVIPPDDDPLLAAMIEQTKRGKPTPKPGQAVGPKLSKADRVAAMKARSLAGDVVKESELTGLTLAERIEARGGQQAIEAAKATGDRSEYSAYLKKHGQTSEVRRGEHNDLTRDPIKMAEKEALQAQADALPDTEEGNRLRDILYQQWKKLKDEHGVIGPRGDGPKPGFRRLYRTEPKVLGDSGDWLKKHLTPEQWETFVAERGRLFSDNLDAIKNYGASLPENNTFFVDVPEEMAKQWGRQHHADNFTEYLVPPDVVAKKSLWDVGDEAGKAALKMLAGTGAASGGLLTAALAVENRKRDRGRP